MIQQISVSYVKEISILRNMNIIYYNNSIYLQFKRLLQDVRLKALSLVSRCIYYISSTFSLKQTKIICSKTASKANNQKSNHQSFTWPINSIISNTGKWREKLFCSVGLIDKNYLQGYLLNIYFIASKSINLIFMSNKRLRSQMS